MTYVIEFEMFDFTINNGWNVDCTDTLNVVRFVVDIGNRLI